MTPRERLIETMRGNVPDRVPVAPFVQEEYLCWHYPHKTSVDRVVDAVELAEELDFDLMAKHRGFEQPHWLRKSLPNWELRRTTETADGLNVVRREIVTLRRTLTEVQAVPEAGRATAGLSWTTRKHLIETREDAEAFLEFLPPLDDATADEMRRTARTWRTTIGERGVAAPWGWAGVFNFAARLCGIEALMIAPYDDEPGYRALMSGLAAAMADYNRVLGEAGVECIGIQGHMANSNTVSPAYFREFVQPYERQVIAAIHATGAFTVYHNCGFARSLYGNYRELGMTVWETVTEPPRGDNNLAEAKAALGDAVCLLGNLDQVDFLKRATPAEVAEATRRIVETGKPGGRFIFSASDFLERNTPRENVAAMIAAAKEAGGYSSRS
jgi:uroporphyrinogen-III decarboxylase